MKRTLTVIGLAVAAAIFDLLRAWLAGELSGADLTTLLLEVFRRRADQLSPAVVMRRYRTDRFMAPAATDCAVLRRAEDVLVSLPEVLEMLLPARSCRWRHIRPWLPLTRAT